MEKLLLLLILLTQPLRADIKEFAVFDIKKNLPLKNNQKIYTDYYVNLGLLGGARKGESLEVYRRLPVVDVYRDKSLGDMTISIGRLKIIHVEEQMSVARLERTSVLGETPVVAYEKVMLGDRVRLAPEEEPPKPKKVARKVSKKPSHIVTLEVKSQPLPGQSVATALPAVGPVEIKPPPQSGVESTPLK